MLGKLERGELVLGVAEVGARAGAEEQPHDGVVALQTRRHQRRPPERVLAVERGVVLEEEARDRLVAVEGGVHQRGAAL